MNKKNLINTCLISFIVLGVLNIFGCAGNPEDRRSQEHMHDKSKEREILYYTDGMHPSVRVSPEEYAKGFTQCPICHMDLVPVYEEVAEEENEKIVVKLTPREAALAGVATSEIKVRTLFKEIRASGIVAFDPQLRTAEEEYIQALNTYDKMSQSDFADAKVRVEEILRAAKIKLELMGLTQEWIDELSRKRVPHNNLILPEKNMWVYADIYEYEATWPKVGDKVTVTSKVDPAIIFKGEVKAIVPVMNEKIRTLNLKILVENKRNLLKPNMFVNVYLKTNRERVLAIDRDAVLNTGMRKIVYVDVGEGKYVLREVKVGPEATVIINGSRKRYFPVVEGVSRGEKVVTKANFLIDSQSQLTGPAAAAYGGALDEK
jgi:multidrug efflux pump subunit AcrA (membrane-fusion protein)